MRGIIATYQTCPKCGAKFPSSKGGFPIICPAGCQTQPTKYYIKFWWKGRDHIIYRDRSGDTVHHWNHAIALLGEIRSEMDRHGKLKGYFDPGAYQRQSKTSFEPFWNQFVAKYKGSTHDKLNAIGQHHLTYFHQYQMRDIQPFHIDQWWMEMQDKGLSPKYLNDIMTWLKSFFRWAKQYKVITEEMYFPKSVETPEPEVDEWLTEADQDAVFAALPDYDKPVFDFLFLTGCRVNEACGLKRADVDWNRSVVIIQHTVKRDGSVGITKNKKKRRVIMSPQIRECLKQAMVAGVIKFDHAEYQFINKWGRRYSDDYLRDAFEKACHVAGIKPIKLKNATRHSAGMRLISRGYGMESVRDFYGHSSTRMTRHYAKVLDEQMVDMYERGGDVGKEKKRNG